MKKHNIFYLLVIVSLLLSGCAGISQLDASAVVPWDADMINEEMNPTLTEGTETSTEKKLFILDTNQYEELIISLYKSASPSVVNITSVAYVFNRMVGQLPEEGVGSGFVYDSEGHIITNYHVIEGADELIVTLSTGEKYDAKVVGVDTINDLAVLSIEAGQELPAPLSLADSNMVEVGETVLAIGNPYGLDWTLTTGVVSALGRVIESTERGQYIAEAIQTDAAINPGNSGGPLLNTQGEVVGITSQIISSSGSSAGLGFAVSSNTIRRIVSEIIANGYYPHPWLGVEMIDLTDYSIAILKEAGMIVPVESGVLVVGVQSGSPADKSGISSGDRRLRFGPYIIPVGGDIITAINGTPVENQQDLMVYLETKTKIGEVVELSILRNGQALTVRVTLTEQ